MKSANPMPPRWADRFLEWFCTEDHLEIVQGDLHELFYKRLDTMSRFKAALLFIIEVLGMLRPFALRRRSKNKITMIDLWKVNLKTAYRSLRARKAFALLNIFGLAMGIAACLLIFMVIKFENSYDNWHSKQDRIYRLTSENQWPQGYQYSPFMPFPTGKTLRSEFPDMATVASVYFSGGGHVIVDGQEHELNTVFFAEQEFLDIFDYEAVAGKLDGALASPGQIVLTLSSAYQLFGSANVIGKQLQLGNDLPLMVAAVIKDPPNNTHLKFQALVAYGSFTDEYYALDIPLDGWGLVDHGGVYVLLNEKEGPARYEALLPNFQNKYIRDDHASYCRWMLQPLADIHFDMRYAGRNLSRTVSPGTLWGIAGIGLIILIAACINFINLMTAQSTRRAKEVGMRKVLGARHPQLMQQFIAETFLVTALATLIAIIGARVLLPQINYLLEMSLSAAAFLQWQLWVFVLSCLALVVILAGTYPAFVLSGMKTLTSLKSNLTKRRGKGLHLRRSLVIVQFVITNLLLIATVVIYQQVSFMRTKDLGYSTHHVARFWFPDQDSTKNFLFKQEAVNLPGVQSMTLSSAPPTINITLSGIFEDMEVEESSPIRVQHRVADKDYLRTFGLQLLAAHPAMEKLYTNQQGVIVNEALIKKLGIDTPADALGHKIQAGWGVDKTMIIGVIRDYHNRSLQNAIMPVIVHFTPKYFFGTDIQLASGALPNEAMAQVEALYRTMYPGAPFSYRFLDDARQTYYSEENRQFSLFKFFAIIAILIGCLGLLGLISFMTIARVKEIGVRKVFGASAWQIIRLIAKEFVALLAVGLLLAIPLGWLLMDNWLQAFAFRINLGVKVFAITAGVSFVVSAVSIGYQTIRAARANPVESLRYE